MSESVNTIASKNYREIKETLLCTVHGEIDSARLELIVDWTQEYYSNDRCSFRLMNIRKIRS